MLDIILLILLSGTFLLAEAYVLACDHLRGTRP